ncbi:MAG: DEAD/DEAH box helicase [Clostridia bacterium]|nr:DEAD/DEAH box helicase [Clostridia bacterium]
MNEKAFESLALSPETLRAIQDAGYTEMTDIQQKVIPVIMEGRDVIGQASTGTGKTAAFGIPCLERIEMKEEEPEPQMLVLCPTRELAMQVCDELRKFSKYREGMRIVPVYGGQNIENQIRALKAGATVVVGTPGRVIDHISRRTLKLGGVRFVVLDEADEMLDMGFLDDIRRILFAMPQPKQTMLFSATMPSPILRITQRFLTDPVHVKGDDGQVAFDLIAQYYCEVPKNKKAASIRLLFEQQGASRGLVFCNTKSMVDRLTRELRRTGLAADCLHGDMRQNARTEIMRRFKSGELNILIATDVAARGIDASGVDIIINYDIPQDMEYYVHRIGRTGRAGHTGTAFTLIAGSGELFDLRDIEDTTGIQLRPYYLGGIDEAEEDGFSSRDSERAPRREGREGGRRGAGRGARPSAGSAVISVDVGRNHDVSEKNIVASLMKHARVKRSDIRSVTVRDDDSLIELDPETARLVMRSMKDATVSDFLVTFKAVSGPSGDSGGRGGSSSGGGRGGQRRRRRRR